MATTIAVTGGSGRLGSYVLDELTPLYENLVNIDARPSARHGEVMFRQVDLVSLDQACQALAGADVVVHLAAIPNPTVAPLDEVMKVNTTGVYNVLEAMRRNGQKLLVYGSSDSATGFGIHSQIIKPQYLPIDAAHPCHPHESYSMSKRLGEIMCQEYSTVHGIAVVSLRFMGIWFHDMYATLREKLLSQRRDQAKNWLGSYVMAQDAARSVAQAVQYVRGMDGAAHETFFVHATSTHLDIDTLTQAKQIWGQVPEIRVPDVYQNNPRAPFFDTATAARKLGYEAQFDIRSVVPAGVQADSHMSPRRSGQPAGTSP